MGSTQTMGLLPFPRVGLPLTLFGLGVALACGDANRTKHHDDDADPVASASGGSGGASAGGRSSNAGDPSSSSGGASVGGSAGEGPGTDELGENGAIGHGVGGDGVGGDGVGGDTRASSPGSGGSGAVEGTPSSGSGGTAGGPAPIPCGNTECAEDEACYLCGEAELCYRAFEAGNECSRLCRPGFSRNPDEKLWLNTPEEAEQLAALQCEVIRRDLGIAGAELVTLSGLETIRVIEGSLGVYFSSALGDFEGLNGLEAIGGDLYLEHAPSLTSLSGLEALDSIGGSLLLQTDSLTSLAGLSALAFLGGSIFIDSNDSLTSVVALQDVVFGEGDLLIRDNPELTSLVGLEGLSSRDTVTISGSNGFADLTGLGGLEQVSGELRVERSNLPSLKGLDALRDDVRLSIERNLVLASLEGLENVESAEHIAINRNEALLSTDGLSSLKEVTQMELLVNPTLYDATFPALTVVHQNLKFQSNTLVPEEGEALSLDFPALETVGDELSIEYNGVLERLSFPVFDPGGESQVDIIGNDGAFTFEFTSFVDGKLRIGDNPDLLSLDGFDSLPPLDAVSVWGNPHVPQCEADAWLAPGGYCFCYDNDEIATCE